ncbi:MAG: phosphoribosylaminoimidazolesuccinocarboxamide synthase [Candidatus Hadarchaeales archaeon]
MKEEIIYEGKTKILLRREGRVFLRFKNTVLGDSAGRPDPGGDFVVGEAEGKGELCAATAAMFFELLKEKGMETHFVGRSGKEEIEVFLVEPIPLEVIYRRLAYGSFLRRYGPLVKPLSPLDLVEFTLKNDALGDPLLSSQAIPMLGIATGKEVGEMRVTARRVGEAVHEFLSSRGLELVDLKVEFGRKAGTLILIDALNGDTMRAAAGGRVLEPMELMKKLVGGGS